MHSDREVCYRVEGNTIVGTAVVYNQSSATLRENGEVFTEIIKPKSFRNLADNITFTFGHNDTAVYGDTASGTLRLDDTEEALNFELDLPAYANALRQAIEDKTLKGMSIRFSKDKYSREQGKHVVTEGRLYHVAAVTRPAFPTEVRVRSMNSYHYKIKVREHI